MSRTSVIQVLRRQVALGSGGRLRAQEIDEGAQLFDRGYLDSFSYVEFLALIEHTYRVRIEDSHLAGHLSTLEAMAEHIVNAQASSAE
jgi:acyl carrier protein